MTTSRKTTTVKMMIIVENGQKTKMEEKI